jgi:hypothetical protein
MRRQGGNSALRVLLIEAGISNAALARAIVALGSAEGIHLGTTTTSVRRMLDGAQPRWPVPRLVAAVLSRRLGREISVVDCGFTDRVAAAEDRLDGLRCAGSLEGTVRTVVDLSVRDLNRRGFLVGSTFAVSAFSQPALLALTVPSVEAVSRLTGRRIGSADIEVVTEHLSHLRRLDHRYGAGRVRDQVVHLVHRQGNAVLHGAYDEATGRALLESTAQAAWLTGSMAADVGRHALAQRYYIQALNLATSAGSRAYAANVLSHMSRLTLQMGQGNAAVDERMLHARQSVALARAGLGVGGRELTPALVALLNAVQARGHAVLGDVAAARECRRQAEGQYQRHRTGQEPAWLGFYTQSELDADLGRCLRDLGDGEPAVRLLNRALENYEPWRARSRCFVHTDLAAAHLVDGNHDRAALSARQAIRAAGALRSIRTIDRLRILRRSVRPVRERSAVLRSLDDELTDFLSRSRRERSEAPTS